ncbi:fam-a protein [Plasmodium chabaudi chabaudi]|uniref:Fam-a protein n=1 Tax=Plasmodium chabaudi chabaudi TaxID=31271 RepID=A0A4V0K8M6_PLACU|nr:fam-a protein [Plasmodium chabaudi chabaudi]VTZ69479.1 fam-a protein [Plasmodium chabaudi chabaudi]|eukprot:XP_016654143.1 fam-a protein [Plasmodium chabaudi chabaudi]
MNKFYIQISLFLLSIFAYANNEALAAEYDPRQPTNLRTRYPTSGKIHEKNSHQSSSYHDYISEIEIMDEAVKHLEYHATNKNGYEVYLQNPNDSISYYVKKFNDQTDILKVNLNIYSANQYDGIVNRIWDPKSPNFFNKGNVEIIHEYNPNLVLIRQFCEQDSKYYHKYFYALVKKAQISKDKAIIAMTSVDIFDANPSSKEPKNPIVKKADLFHGYVYPEYYILCKECKKIYVNLAGYLIEKKGDDLEITYIESIEGHSSI